MRHLLHIIGNLIGFAADIVGLIGGSDQAGKVGGWLTVIHHYLSDPWVYFPLTLGGSLVLALVWSDWLLECKLSHAGGVTKREYPARFDQWDSVQNFAVWHLSWLWNDLEPQDREKRTEGTDAYPTFQKLEDVWRPR